MYLCVCVDAHILLMTRPADWWTERSIGRISPEARSLICWCHVITRDMPGGTLNLYNCTDEMLSRGKLPFPTLPDAGKSHPQAGGDHVKL